MANICTHACFLMGTAVVVGAGEEAKQDFWIAELIAIILGSLIVIAYFYLIRYGGDRNLYQLIKDQFGTYLGGTIIFCYVIYFLYLASRNIRDLTELMRVTIMPLTPIEVVSIMMILLVTYTVFLGLEILGRVTEIVVPYIVGLILFIALLLFVSGEMDFQNLQPIFAEGFQPILKAIFPTLLTFPYGELIVFTVFMASTNHISYVGKISVSSILCAGMLILLSDLIQITVLGVDLKGRSLFPLLVAAREINILGFFERVDILVVFILTTGIFIKVSVFFLASIKGLQFVFNVHYRDLVLPIGMLISYYSIVIASNVAEHFEEGLQLVPYVLHIPFQFIIPTCIFLLLAIKKMRKRGNLYEHF